MSKFITVSWILIFILSLSLYGYMTNQTLEENTMVNWSYWPVLLLYWFVPKYALLTLGYIIGREFKV